MKFEWEELCSYGTMGSARAKVIGGWIVRNVSWTNRWGEDQVQCVAESTVFIPDPEHKWEIE